MSEKLEELISLLYQDKLTQYGKRLLVENIEKLQKENEELKADNYELNNRISDLLENIPIQKVKDKIKELKEAYEDSKDENGESQYYYPDYTIRVLEELLEKRK